jgi:hypothetical protein
MTARFGLSLILLLASCDGETPDAPPDEPPKPEAPAHEPVVVVEPPPAPVEPAPVAPPPVSFDPATATEIKVRVVVIHPDQWVPCGIIHSTGVIEVEVLEVGEPPPRMALIISCPGDLGHLRPLEVGVILQVKLFASRQSWPTPPSARKLPPELPRRYAKTLTRVDVSPTSPAPGPAPQSDAAPE